MTRSLGLALWLLFFVVAPASAQQLLGFVDLESIVEKHPASQRAETELKAEMSSRLEALRQEGDKMRTLRDDVDLYAPGTPEHLEQLKRIRILEATLDLDKKMLRIEFDLKLAEQIARVYEEARSAVEAVAKEKKVQVVAMYSKRKVSGKSRSDVVSDIITRPFVYHDTSLDLTADVLARLGVK